MKRMIKANGWYTGEPDSSEYGKAASEVFRNFKVRYAPFEVSFVHFNSFSANPSGYLISLASNEGEYRWYLEKSGSFDTTYRLYGPTVNNRITSRDYYHLPIEKDGFTSIDNAMSYLFTAYSDLISED